MACSALDARLSEWRSRLPQDLEAVPEETYELERVEGRWVSFGTSKHLLDEGATLVVIGVLVHTWRWPTWVSFGAVGRFFAEGLLVEQDGSVQEAPDDLMWEFR